MIDALAVGVVLDRASRELFRAPKQKLQVGDGFARVVLQVDQNRSTGGVAHLRIERIAEFQRPQAEVIIPVAFGLQGPSGGSKTIRPVGNRCCGRSSLFHKANRKGRVGVQLKFEVFQTAGGKGSEVQLVVLMTFNHLAFLPAFHAQQTSGDLQHPTIVLHLVILHEDRTRRAFDFLIDGPAVIPNPQPPKLYASPLNRGLP